MIQLLQAFHDWSFPPPRPPPGLKRNPQHFQTQSKSSDHIQVFSTPLSLGPSLDEHAPVLLPRSVDLVMLEH